MKIFNKYLKKNFDSRFILKGIQNNNSVLGFGKTELISKSFARNFNNNNDGDNSPNFMKNFDESVKQPEKKPFSNDNFKEERKGKKDSFEFEGKSEFGGYKKKEFQGEFKERERKPFNNKFNDGENSEGGFKEKKFQRKRYDEDSKFN